MTGSTHRHSAAMSCGSGNGQSATSPAGPERR
jgi:hypothetical protein